MAKFLNSAGFFDYAIIANLEKLERAHSMMK